MTNTHPLLLPSPHFSFLSSMTGQSVGQTDEEETNCSVRLCLQQTAVYHLQRDGGGSNGSIVCDNGKML